MPPFGFVPLDNSDEPDENPAIPEGTPDFAALFAYLQSQLQEQFGEKLPEDFTKDIQEQFSKLGINPLGFMQALSKTDSSFPIDISRNIGKKYVLAQGSALVGTNEAALIRWQSPLLSA